MCTVSGEAYSVPFDPQLVAQHARPMCSGAIFAGEDPHHIEKLWRRVYSAGYTQHRIFP